ncbi:hypothetical protein KFL_001080070 [Klebsormidium nitens]|uniref:Uncharacterized protein n=1 Tax=Klebsormidium nitens TaxID=105231 RepID=A0A1Y1HZH0_KLENI|nr:hypothetical protein KFL_001080070 [Klebsormidium nitens]|eukprot:GAQ82331.1 hypothetical protein KFL_001080070 [Klebsormidium nitens]
MAQFQESVMEQVARLRDAHADATRLLRANFETRRPTKPQPSVKLLDQRKIQHTLGKQGKYDEAEQVKSLADKLERQELQAAEAAWQSELGMREQTLSAHQQVEMEALMQRATRGRDELRKARTIDLERREQRYRNVRTELEAVHRLEALKFEANLEKKIIAGKRDEKTVASNLGLKARRASVSARSRTTSRTSKVSYSAYV